MTNQTKTLTIGAAIVIALIFGKDLLKATGLMKKKKVSRKGLARSKMVRHINSMDSKEIPLTPKEKRFKWMFQHPANNKEHKDFSFDFPFKGKPKF